LREKIDNQKFRPFLSIRWKLFLALAGLIVLIHTIFAVGFLNYQKYSYLQMTEGVKEERIRFLKNSVSAAAQSLHVGLDEVFLNSHDKNQTIRSVLRNQINQHFTDTTHQNLFNSISLYDENIELVQHWGTLAFNLSDNRALLIEAKDHKSGIQCAESCSLYLIKKFKTQEGFSFIVVAQQQLSQLLSQFSSANQLSVGLVREFASKADFESWEHQLFELSQSSITMPLLVKLSRENIQLKTGKDYLISAFDNKYLISFQERLEDQNKWVFIQDISEMNGAYQQRVTNVFLLGVFSLVLSLCLLYVIVNRIAHQLPRILEMTQALGLEGDVGSAVNKSGNKRILDDELQQYDRQLAKISHKMDLLRQTESNNAIKLQATMRELDQTKSFIDRLLNDQQTIILVQKLGGEIIALNQAGCKLFEIEDFNGLTYAEIFCSDLLEEDGLAALNYLYLGGETLVKAEVQWRNSKDELFTLLWVHALLSVPGTIDPVILSVCVDITAQRKAEDRLEWLAFNDPSLINYNKQVFLEYLPFAISRSLERHKILALLYCEVNGLPEQSDEQSNDTNPQIMKRLSERMSGCLRQYDMLTQLSEDHFVIILEGLSDVSDAEIVTDKIISNYKKPVEIDDNAYYIEITIGASYAPDHTESVPELLRNAEMAMFQAKRKNIDYFSAVIADV
jgi:diguanylate cyclase (GGDEF)-like protein